MKRIESEATELGDQKAKKILGMAIQRMASDCVAENTVSVVDLPSEDMKGRIIGREGRNIRALELATRSEERRVGKECRWRWEREQEGKKGKSKMRRYTL